MTAKIITIAQQKGGAGKTTLVAQLAVALAAGKRKVALIDIDPQASLTAWHGLRRKTLGQDAGGIHLSVVAGWQLSNELNRLRDGFDLLIVDSAANADTENRAAIRASDLVMVPMQPSLVDLWATGPTLALAEKQKTRAILLLNRVPPRGKLLDTIRQKIREQDLPCMKATLGNRVAFAASMLEGRGVLETEKSSIAAKEVLAVLREVEKSLKTV
ncbi:MAG: ParA family partition ATPase [Rhodospirillales bacterium]